MGQSYRIRTELGINKAVNVELNQDYEFLEILSLKIQQADIYTRSCSEYGVIVGRVTANNGFGIPNAKVAVFIPVTDVDLADEVISSIYPYKTLTQVNSDGYRYNLLPYEKSYSKHAATGTFPSRIDALTNSTVIELVDKYYKFTVKTNESGDYMIMGVPIGFQTLLMDVDLSDMGEFSLTPQDLIRIGRATPAQVSGNKFKASTDLNSLPQILSITKTVEVSPLWGEPDICQIAINRVDFDLRDDANIDIQPTAIFMGSMFSTDDKFRVRKNCKPKDNMGNLCNLTTGPGQILALRQTIRQDKDGNPILEQYQLEQSGNVIDGDGTWMLELPMNLEYVITNEFGEKIVSYDPKLGIPTKGKYRFKIKWQQSKELTAQTRRPFFLVPNVKEYGWDDGNDPTNSSSSSSDYKQQQSSYYFGLDWSGYTNGFSVSQAQTKIDEIVNCDDTFYEFGFNRVYTVASLIDEYKKGGRARFIGIKEIDDDSCADSVNKFPVNEGFKNFDFLYFLFSLIFQILQFVGLAILIIAHFTIGFIYQLVNALGRLFGKKPKNKGLPIRLPMVTYPDCEACECREASTTGLGVDLTSNGILTPLSNPSNYIDGWQKQFVNYEPAEDIDLIAQIHAQATGGNATNSSPTTYKVTKSEVVREVSEDGDKMFCWSFDLPLGERINIFNSRISYFNGINKIKVSFATDYSNNNSLFHLDNTITVLATTQFTSGSLFTTVDPESSKDYNFNFSSSTAAQLAFGITGTSITGPSTVTVKYVNPTNQLSELTQTYNLPYGSNYSTNAFPIDREYFQVVTALTVSDFFKLQKQSPSLQSFAEILNSETVIRWMEHRSITGYRERSLSKTRPPVAFKDLYQDFANQYVLIMQRGVDPYSPKFTNKYNLGLLFGSTIDDPKYVITATTKMNIPIQKLSSGYKSVQDFTQAQMFEPSYFFTPGTQFSAFTSTTVGYYSDYDVITGNAINPQNYFGAEGFYASNNEFYSKNISSGKYDKSEDLSGNAELLGDTDFGSTYKDWDYEYYSPSAYPSLLKNPMSISNKTKNVMRTDRLPSSDQLDGPSWNSNAFLLQQNNNFAFYEIPDLENGILVPNFGTGFQQVSPDIEGLPNSDSVLESFSCVGMVGLSCYTGFSDTFGVSTTCRETDQVERGCYVFFTKPLFGLVKDIRYFQEWGYRYRFFYAICRGVLSQTFTNNWINGTLYAFPIQVDTIYNRQNKPEPPKFCNEIVYFENKTNNFYFRSSPYSSTQKKFIGKPTTDSDTSVNIRELLFPTTIVNLGYKDSFYGEITLDPQANAFVLDKLNPTSYSDTSDLVNFFVISRIVDENFLQQFFSFLSRNNSINQLFSRNSPIERKLRVDGDLAQLFSINSEEGLIKFSPDFYESKTGQNNPLGIYGTPGNPTVAVFYSSTTENLQFKDYISPGRVNLRATTTSTASSIDYTIKSQMVPFYPWKVTGNINNLVFGTQNNNWATGTSDIKQRYYQSLDRTSQTDYFKAKGLNNDLSMRGYIFNVSGDTETENSLDYTVSGPPFNNQFIVGAPFQFYFGTVVGATVLEKFKTKYLSDE